MERSVHVAALDRAAKHEVMRAPAVVGPVAVRGERAPEIRSGEERHVVVHVHLHEPGVEIVHRGVDLRELLVVLREEDIVVVEAADAHQEHLAARPDARRGTRGDDTGHYVELRGKAAVRGDGKCGCRRQGSAQLLVRCDGAIRDHAQFVLDEVWARAGDQALVGRYRGFEAVSAGCNKLLRPRSKHRRGLGNARQASGLPFFIPFGV